MADIKLASEEFNYARISKTFIIDVGDKQVTVTKWVNDAVDSYLSESDWDIDDGGDTLTDEEHDELHDFVDGLSLYNTN